MQAFRRPSGWATECNGTAYVAVLEDELGTIRFAFCDTGRTSALDAWEARQRRRNWAITYVDPKTI